MKQTLKNSLKKFILLSLLVAIPFVFYSLYEDFTGNFNLSNIRLEKTLFQPKSYPTDLNEKKIETIKKILDQKFTFLGKGNQTYAFLSEDSNYVLKFFKLGHLKNNGFLDYLPKTDWTTRYLDKKTLSQQKRFFKVFDGYDIAYREDPENSALIFIHLNSTNHLNQKVHVQDRLFMTHEIDLDSVVFIIQEKVIPTKKILSSLFDKKDIKGVKEKIHALFQLYISQYEKGLYDMDHNLIHNTGFKGNKPIRFDVGKLTQNDNYKNPEVYRKDLEKIAFFRLHRFLKRYYPSYEKEIVKFMEEDIDKLIQGPKHDS